jgi:hypothetical protein
MCRRIAILSAKRDVEEQISQGPSAPADDDPYRAP